MICDCDLTLVTDKFQFVIDFYLILIPLTHRFFICSIDRGMGRRMAWSQARWQVNFGIRWSFLTKKCLFRRDKSAKFKLQNMKKIKIEFFLCSFSWRNDIDISYFLETKFLVGFVSLWLNIQSFVSLIVETRCKKLMFLFQISFSWTDGRGACAWVDGRTRRGEKRRRGNDGQYF